MNIKFFQIAISPRLRNVLLLITCFLASVAITFGTVAFGNKAQAASPFLYWPVPSNYSIACGYGCYAGHVGIDIGVTTDNTTPIYAAANGTVVSVTKNQPFGVNRVTSSANGNYVKLKHDINGELFYSWYLHLTNDVKVNVNDTVRVGQLLGYGSNSGFTCGTQLVNTGGCQGYGGSFWHLHFQVSTACGENSCSKDPEQAGWWVKDNNGKVIAATNANPIGYIDNRLYLLELDATNYQGKYCIGTNVSKIGTLPDANRVKAEPCRSIQELRWHIINDGNEYYRFELAAIPPSKVKQCLDINGTKIGQLPDAVIAKTTECRPIQEQQFKVVNNSGGYMGYQLRATPPSGVKQCLDIDGTRIGTYQGAEQVKAVTCSPIREQRFRWVVVN